MGKGGAGFPLAREWALALGRIGAHALPLAGHHYPSCHCESFFKEGSLRKDDEAISGYSWARRGAVRLPRPSFGGPRNDMGKGGVLYVIARNPPLADDEAISAYSLMRRGTVRLPRPSAGGTRNDMMMGWGSPSVRRSHPPLRGSKFGGG